MFTIKSASVRERRVRRTLSALISAVLLFAFLISGFAAAEDAEESPSLLDSLMSGTYDYQYHLTDSELPEPAEVWTYRSGLLIGLFDIFDNLAESSLPAAQAGEDFHGIPSEWLAREPAEAETAVLIQQVSVNSTSKSGKEHWIYARLVFVDAQTGTPLSAAVTPYVYLTEAEKAALDLSTVESCTQFLEEFSAKLTHPDGYKDRYYEAVALYNDGKYYSARQAFIESEYGNWEEMADKCILERPAAGEVWRDPNAWQKDMELTVQIDQPEETAIYIRLYKDGSPVSSLFIPGSGKVTVRLPGNGTYMIKDGIGTDWYGVKEAFGREGSYETMTFDDEGSETVYLESNYAYTISINVSGGGTGIGSKDEEWDNFAE